MTSSKKLLLGMLVLCCGFGMALLFRKEPARIQATAPLEMTAEPTPQGTLSSSGHLVLRHPADATPRYALEGWPTARTNPSSTRSLPTRTEVSDQPPTPRRSGAVQEHIPEAYSEAPQPVKPPPLPDQFPRSNALQLEVLPIYGSIFHRRDQLLYEASPTIHRVRDGDTLTELAERYFGSADWAATLYEWNQDQIDNPDLLPIGIDLRLTAPNVGRGSLRDP